MKQLPTLDAQGELFPRQDPYSGAQRAKEGADNCLEALEMEATYLVAAHCTRDGAPYAGVASKLYQSCIDQVLPHLIPELGSVVRPLARKGNTTYSMQCT